ncbi:hypothetical protein [Sphingomonas sp. AX6]|uniref:hypothetical protein n=1 Tax=Sphingomonas sp. AX6 TaxID=2653171 RepID=UPI0012EF7BD9|nr:hypothetical protein [Sphingomonas sp. AX6]VXC80391.1 conserved membrane hypothetical protein [Sphingomonas sp. AX6]
MVDRIMWAKKGGGIALCGVFGAIGGYLFGQVIPKGSLDWMQGADVAALLIAAMMIATAGVVFWFTLDEARFKKRVEGRDDPEVVDPAAIHSTRLQALVLIASGVFLALPVASAGLGLAGAGRTSALLVALALLLLLIWETRLNFRIWRESDEMVRQAMLVTCAVCFFGVQLVFISYAALVRLELAPEIGLWPLAVSLMAIYLAVSFVISLRFGFGKP